uniref:Uncharacterized protein n=1 Tax=Rangifer tarandus platyrhynchus TaxID=3082113 RepID=A0ACB0E2Z3_RANTA|nr:unnamed protein product [Rangifer tarandus platyrhynchus]
MAAGAAVVVAAVAEAGSARQCEELLRLRATSFLVVRVWAPRAPQCAQMNDVMAELAKGHPQVAFMKLEAEAVPEVSEKYEINEVRQALKTYSSWPTYPQHYVSGELIGGLDIIKQLEASKELDMICPKTPKLEQSLKVMTNKASLMLFMKGNKQEAKCGFSRQILEILNSTGVEYETFDILEDEQVQQGLKAYSNWPTYPQLYVKWELIGGLDIDKELKENGDLLPILKGEN